MTEQETGFSASRMAILRGLIFYGLGIDENVSKLIFFFFNQDIALIVLHRKRNYIGRPVNIPVRPVDFMNLVRRAENNGANQSVTPV